MPPITPMPPLATPTLGTAQSGLYAQDRLKIVALCIGVTLLVVLVSAASFWAFSEIETAATARKQTSQIISRASNFLSELKDAETG